MYEFLKRRSCTEVLPARFFASCSTATQHIFIVASVYTKQTVTTPACVIVKIKPTYQQALDDLSNLWKNFLFQYEVRTNPFMVLHISGPQIAAHYFSFVSQLTKKINKISIIFYCLWIIFHHFPKFLSPFLLSLLSFRP